MYALMTAALLVYCAIRRESLKFSHRLALIGACEVIAYATISWGYGATPHTSIVALVSGAFSLPTIVLARLVLKERTGRLRAVASIVIVAGIALLSAHCAA
jgi:drug/metabolite transporter (DMT)-like permease